MKFPASSRGLSGKQEAGSQGEPLPPAPIQQPGTAPTGDTGRVTQERPEARRIRSSETCRAGRGLGSPRAGRRVERPPGWALGGPPARTWPALTSRSGGPGSRLQPSPGRTGASGAGAAAEAPTPRELAQSGGPPSLSARREAGGGRCCPLSALPRLPAAHATPTARRARPRPPGAARRLLSAPRRRLSRPARRAPARCSFGKAAPSGGAGSGRAGEPAEVGRGGGGGRHAPLRLRRPQGRSAGLGPGRGGGRGLRGSGGARGDSRGSPGARAREEEEEERGGCGLAQRACGLRSQRRWLGMSQPGRPGRPRCVRADRIGGRCLPETFPFLLSLPQAARCPKRSAQGTWHRGPGTETQVPDLSQPPLLRRDRLEEERTCRVPKSHVHSFKNLFPARLGKGSQERR